MDLVEQKFMESYFVVDDVLIYADYVEEKGESVKADMVRKMASCLEGFLNGKESIPDPYMTYGALGMYIATLVSPSNIHSKALLWMYQNKKKPKKENIWGEDTYAWYAGRLELREWYLPLDLFRQFDRNKPEINEEGHVISVRDNFIGYQKEVFAIHDLAEALQKDKREKWGEGEWLHEPDYYEWIDEVSGYLCIVNRNHLGAWTGYVCLSMEHPYYGWPDRERPRPRIESVSVSWTGTAPPNLRRNDDFVIGFDCGSGMDYVPGRDRDYQGTDFMHLFRYRNYNYIVKKTKKLADELYQIANRSTTT